MTTKKTGKKETEGEFDLGIGGIFKGLGEFVEKIGDLSEKVKVEPLGNIHKNKKGEAVVDEMREPIVDIFEESNHTMIVAEMPGVEEKDSRIDLKDDILQISAETREKQ